MRLWTEFFSIGDKMTTTMTTGPAADEKLIDARELAEKLGLKYLSVLRMGTAGRIPSVLVSPRRRRFLLSAVLTHLGAEVSQGTAK